jgi:hypothetical protein
MTKLIVAFGNFANAPKKHKLIKRNKNGMRPKSKPETEKSVEVFAEPR